MKIEYYITPKQVESLPNVKSQWKKTFKYAKMMEAGIEFAPVNLYFSKDLNRWTYNDGRNRVMAAKLTGLPLKVKSSKRMGNERK